MTKLTKSNKIKNIVLTGAGGGIGFETLNLLLQTENVHVTAFTRNENKLRSVLGTENSNLVIKQLDFTDFPKTFNFATYFSHLNAIDILINNAGYLVNKPF